MHASARPSSSPSLLSDRCREPLIDRACFLWPIHGCGCTHPSCVCVCRMAQRPWIPLRRPGPLEKQHYPDRVIMNTVSVVVAARMTSTSSCEHAKGAQSLKVRACTRTMSTRLDLTPCLPAGHRGCPWLPGYPALRAKKSGPHARTPGSLERRAPRRPPRWQDASFWWTRRAQSDSGGTRAPWRAPVMIWSLWPCAWIMRECARPVQRLLVTRYSEGPASVGPVSTSHGPNWDTWRHSETLKLVSVLSICRPGDAVVSGGRETGHYT